MKSLGTSLEALPPGLGEVWKLLEFGSKRHFPRIRELAVTIKRLELLFIQIKTRIAFTTFVGTRKTNYKKNKYL